MANTHAGVIAENFGKFKTAWDANAATAIGASDTPAVLTEDTEPAVPVGSTPAPTISDPTGGTRVVDPTEPYARYRARHTSGRTAAIGRKLSQHAGQIVVQVFHPRRGGVGKAKALALAKVVLDAYQGGSTPTVSYRNVALREIGASGPWYQVNVTAEFDWYLRKS